MRRRLKNYTPDIIAETVKLNLRKGIQKVNIDLTKSLPCQQYAFVTFMRNDKIRLRMSEMRCTGLLSVFNKFNYAVNNHGFQTLRKVQDLSHLSSGVRTAVRQGITLQ